MARLWTIAGQHYRESVTGAPPVSTMPVGNLPGWTQIVANDFLIPSTAGSFRLDYPGMDAVDGTQNVAGTSWYELDRITVHDGLADMRGQYNATNGHFETGCILPNKSNPQIYGKVTCKMWVANVSYPGGGSSGQKVNFLWTPADGVQSGGEIDYPVAGFTSGNYSMHVHSQTTPYADVYALTEPTATVFVPHVYDSEWTPTGIVTKIDGVQFGSTTLGIPTVPMIFRLQHEGGATAPDVTSTANVLLDWVTVYTYAPAKHRIQGWRGSAHYVPPLFTQGQTLPQSSGDPDALGGTENVGYMASNNGTTMATIVGDLTVAAGATVSYKRIQGFVTLGANAILDHCIVEGRHQSSFISNALVTMAGGSKVQYCTIRPSAATLAGNIAYWLNGVNFSGTVTVQRSVFSRCVDSWRTGSSGSKINFWSNLVRDYCFFDNDADQAGSTPASWGHADSGGQRTAVGAGDSIIGNAIWAFMDMTGVTYPGGTNADGSPTAANGGSTVGMPATALNNGYPNGDWGNLLSYTGVGGQTGWYVGFNWFHGGNQASFQITVGTGSSGTLEGNRAGCDGKLLGSGKKVLVKWPTGTTVDVSGAPNVFDTTTDVPVALRGHPWTDAAAQTSTGFSVIPGNF